MTLQAQVLYEYEAQDGDQLTIRPGDIIEILDNSTDLNGWALGRRGDKEGYLPAEYVRFIDQKQYDRDGWHTAEFEQYYTRVLIEEQQMGYCEKMRYSVEEVFIPWPCSKHMYTYAQPDLKRGAILHLLFSFLMAFIDTLTILAPCITFNTDHATKHPDSSQVALTCLNISIRVIVCLWFIGRYPRSNLTLTTFPLFAVLSSLTYSIRVYELLTMGDNKEYDGYRYYRSWMWSCCINFPFSLAGLILVMNGSPGLDALSVTVFVLNLFNLLRCFLTSWASLQSGNDIHSDFVLTIKRYHL